MPTRLPQHKTASRKEEHVEIALSKDVGFRRKSTGLEAVEFLHNALPELDLDDICTETTFLDRTIAFPFMISSMTGGYPNAFRINRDLAEVCQAARIPMGVGSQRQAMEDATYHSTFSIVRKAAPSIPILGNIGAAEVAQLRELDPLKRLAGMIGADGFIVHLNPLQEMLQPEGSPRFRGVLGGIGRLVRELGIPIIVKEIGAGISAEVARRLLEVGVRYIDVAGAGGTSWAGVEVLRRKDMGGAGSWWDWGIPTAVAVQTVARLKEEQGPFTVIASGGISSGLDVAKSLALGADLAASARAMLTALSTGGQDGLREVISCWSRELRQAMFLTGSPTIARLQKAELVTPGYR